jgi:hypothetical protein
MRQNLFQHESTHLANWKLAHPRTGLRRKLKIASGKILAVD